ncbi:MAG: cell division protein FtsW [Verrucomicrobiaceae bacterium]|nr:cell division protein FtsW [Verrucomicrobiaceae bacterium]
MSSRRSIIALSIAVVGLLMVGFVMLGSAGYFTADNGGDTEYGLVRRQFWCLLVGFGLTLFCANWDYHRWLSWRWPLFLVAVVSLILCYVPGIGVKVNGSSRWIGTESARLQPSEFAKVALIIVMAAWYSRHEGHQRAFWRGFVIPACIMAVIAGLIAGEMDLGGAAIACAVGLGIMFVAGSKLRYMPILAGAALVLLILAVANNPNRFARVVSFGSGIPWIAKHIDFSRLTAEQKKEIAAKKTQQVNASLAFGSGGEEGVGPGMGRMKLYSLPEAHTDFILAMVGEELGLQGTLWLVFCFILLSLAGFHITMTAPDHFGRLLAFGLTFFLSIQGLVNMCVVTSLLPNKGLVLPFVSYGRSNLLMAMVCIGVLCNIHRLGGKARISDLGILRGRNREAPPV